MSRPLTVGELFAGIGGFGLAAQRAGHTVTWACEIDPFASRVYRERFPDVAMHPDVQEFPDMTQRLPAPSVEVDLITAGFPCQDVSVAGKRKGLIGERTGLFWHIIRIARRLRPRWLLLENVPGLLSSHRGRDFETILAALAECGYDASWRVLDAQFFGVPQRRRRVFIVGHLGGPCPAEVLFEPESLSGDFKTGSEARAGVTQALTRSIGAGGADDNDAQGGLIVARPITSSCYKNHDEDTDTIIAYQCHGTNVGEMGTLRRGSGSAGGGVPFVTPDLAACLNPGHEAKHSYAGDGGTLNIVGTRPRRLTPRECERLQGFPDDWTLIPGASDSARYRALGNAVAVPVVEWILRRLAEVQG